MYIEQNKNGSHVFVSSLSASQVLISKIRCMLLANQKRDSEFNVLVY